MARPARDRHPRRGEAGRHAPDPEPLYGINPVEAALRAGRRRLLALLLKAGPPSEKLSLLRRLAEERHLPVSEHRATELESLSGSPSHQGAVLRCGPLPLADEDTALAWGARPGNGAADDSSAPARPAPLLLALDQVEDPRNLGAIVRSAAAFAATGVVMPRDHSAPLSAAASSASAGTLESFPVYQAANLARFLEACKRHGFWVAGTVPAGGQHPGSYDHDRPLVLVLGSEARGLRPLVQRQCDLLLTVPLPGSDRVDSLNVSAAAAVVLAYLRARPA